MVESTLGAMNRIAPGKRRPGKRGDLQLEGRADASERQHPFRNRGDQRKRVDRVDSDQSVVDLDARTGRHEPRADATVEGRANAHAFQLDAAQFGARARALEIRARAVELRGGGGVATRERARALEVFLRQRQLGLEFAQPRRLLAVAQAEEHAAGGDLLSFLELDRLDHARHFRLHQDGVVGLQLAEHVGLLTERMDRERQHFHRGRRSTGRTLELTLAAATRRAGDGDRHGRREGRVAPSACGGGGAAGDPGAAPRGRGEHGSRLSDDPWRCRRRSRGRRVLVAL